MYIFIFCIPFKKYEKIFTKIFSHVSSNCNNSFFTHTRKWIGIERWSLTQQNDFSHRQQKNEMNVIRLGIVFGGSKFKMWELELKTKTYRDWAQTHRWLTLMAQAFFYLSSKTWIYWSGLSIKQIKCIDICFDVFYLLIICEYKVF